MSSSASQVAVPPKRVSLPRFGGGATAAKGFVLLYLSVIVLIPIAALVVASTDGGWDAFWTAVSNPQAVATFKLTLLASLAVVVINSISGTIIAWVLVRDDFRGKSLLNSIIDLPFALPTIVAGLVLLALYGENGVLGLSGVSFTVVGVVLALMFVTLPFVIRSVQPTLIELDQEMEEAAASLGAKPLKIFRSVVLPNLMPAILGGATLAFARAVGEFGSLILISGNIPFKTEVTSVHIYGLIETGYTTSAAAVSVVLLLFSVVILFGFHALNRKSGRHDQQL